METTEPKDLILKNGIRILTPSEYEWMRASMISPDDQVHLQQAIQDCDVPRMNRIQRYQIICDAMLHTGMRTVEFSAMERPWYRGPRRVIQIPEGIVKKGVGKKGRHVFSERTVMLSLPGCDAVDRFLQSGLKLPHRCSMYPTLRRYAEISGIGSEGVTTKMFRKTLASWLMACFPEQEMYISASMGHSREVLQKHYLGLGFPTEEIRKMRDIYLKDWGLRL